MANKAYERCRRRRRRGADVSLDQVLSVFDEHGRHVATVADWSTSVDDPARQAELRMVLSTAIDGLPADYRAVVLLPDVEGLSQQETAEALGCLVRRQGARWRRNLTSSPSSSRRHRKRVTPDTEPQGHRGHSAITVRHSPPRRGAGQFRVHRMTLR